MWPQPAPGNGLNYTTKPNTGKHFSSAWYFGSPYIDPYVIYSWPPRDPKDLGQAIFEQQEQPTYHGPQLVRRDSEGYLVREITMEDRMRMLQDEYMYENDTQQQFIDEHFRYDENGEYIDDGEYAYEDEEYVDEGDILEGEWVDQEEIEKEKQ